MFRVYISLSPTNCCVTWLSISYIFLVSGEAGIVVVNILSHCQTFWEQCMKWPVAHSPNSTWFWLELVWNCCERLKIIMKYTNIQFCERLGQGWQFHPLWESDTASPKCNGIYMLRHQGKVREIHDQEKVGESQFNENQGKIKFWEVMAF